MTEITTVLFDLDGTLADTARDMTEALNTVLSEQQRPKLTLEQTRPLISLGSAGLLQTGFDGKLDETRLEELRTRFLEQYSQILCVHTALFDGVEATLDALEQRKLQWGIVTNKPAFLSEPLLHSLGLAQRAACIVSGDTTPHSKPHPLPLQHACAQLGCNPSETAYLGDCKGDVTAAHGAGMISLVALYGFIGETEEPQHWQAGGYLEHPQALIQWLDDLKN